MFDPQLQPHLTKAVLDWLKEEYLGQVAKLTFVKRELKVRIDDIEIIQRPIDQPIVFWGHYQ